MTTPEDDAKRIFGARASDYVSSPCHQDPEVLRMLVTTADPARDWVALDVATGTGHTAFAIAPHVETVIGVDLTPEMLAAAERLALEKKLENVVFREADVHRLPFDDESFNLVTCRRAAHHFSDLPKAIDEMRRVLVWGGRLVIDDRSVPEDDAIDTLMNELDRYHDPSHVRQYRPSEWMRLLESRGLFVESIEPYFKHRPISSLTDTMSETHRQRTSELLDRLTDAQREQLNLEDRNGEWYFNHWYVMLAAIKR